MAKHSRTRIVPIVSRNDRRFSFKFGRAFEKIGFMVLTDHGIDLGKIVRLRRLARELFDLDKGVLRAKYDFPEFNGQRGYRADGETAAGSTVVDFKSFFSIGNPEYDGYPNIWPDEVVGFRDAVLEMYRDLMNLGKWLCRELEKYMKLPKGYLSRMLKGGDTLFRLLDYPEAAEGTVRSGEHEDINLITLLLGAILDGEIESAEPRYTGLDVFGRDGQWHQVYETYNCIVVNVGEMLQHLCALLHHIGMDVPLFVATKHRVVAAPGVTQRRNSYVYFIHPWRGQVIHFTEEGYLEGAEVRLFKRLVELGLMPAPEAQTAQLPLQGLAA